MGWPASEHQGLAGCASPVLELQAWDTVEVLCGFCGLNSGLPVCKAAILPTELFPGPQRTLTMLTCTVVCGYVSVENWGAEEGGDIPFKSHPFASV